MAFFRKSGNSRGVFPDNSIETEKSLFTNDDERDASCPCSVADGEYPDTTTPLGCTIPDPVVQEVTYDDFVA